MNGKGNGKVDLGRKQFFPDDSKKLATNPCAAMHACA